MPFNKAKPEQGKLKISIYGDSGTGKTLTSLLIAEGIAKREGKRIAYIDSERGTDFYAIDIKERKVHPEKFDFDVIYTKSLRETTTAIKGGEDQTGNYNPPLDPTIYSCIVIDSITHFWESAQNSYNGYRTNQNENIPLHMWAKIKKPYKNLISILMDCPFHVFILGREKDVYGNDKSGSLIKTGTAMKAEGETQYEPNICLRMTLETDPSDPEKEVNVMHVRKDRTGILQGNSYINPDFNVVMPILDYLQGSQAQLPDADVVADYDSSLIEQESVTSLKTKITKAKDQVALNEVKQLIELQKREKFLDEKDLDKLRVAFEKKSETFKTKI